MLSSGWAQIVFSGTSYTQNFDTLPTTTVTGQFSATAGTQAGISGLTGWAGAKVAGTGASALSLVAEAGSGNAGAIYSYGATSSSERALGSIASAGAIMAFGASFVNSTGSTLNEITISFTSEFWRSSTSTVNSLAFSYGFSDAGILDSGYLTSSSMASVSSLNVVGPAFVSSNGALNGNDALNQASVSYTLTGVTWNNASTLFIRWVDTNDVGNDAGLAIDNFSLSASAAAIPEPSTYAAIVGSLALGLVAYRRRRLAA